MIKQMSQTLEAVHTHTHTHTHTRVLYKEREEGAYLMLSPLIISKVRRLYVRGGGLIV